MAGKKNMRTGQTTKQRCATCKQRVVGHAICASCHVLMHNGKTLCAWCAERPTRKVVHHDGW